MKTLILLAIPLLLSLQYSFAQEPDTSEITISFTSDEASNFEKKIDSVGSTRYKVMFQVSAKMGITITHDYFIDVSFEHITTGDSSLKIVNPTFRLTPEDLNEGKTAKREIEIKVFHNKEENAQVGRLKLKNEKVTFNEEKHQKIISLNWKKTEIDEVADAQKLLNSIKSSITQSDTIAAAGLELITNNKMSQYYNGNTVFPFEVAKVVIHILEGRFHRVVIHPTKIKGRFESQYPISATNFNRRRTDKLFYVGPDSDMTGTNVVIGDIIDYSEHLAKRQFPPNATVILTPTKPADTIRFVRNPISFFDARIYTDPTGITGNANGLVLTEINAQFIINSANRGKFTWAPYINMNFNWSKFDSQFDTLSLPSIVNRDENAVLSLRQQANVNFLVDFEVLRYSGVHESIFGIGHQLALTDIKDSVGNGTRAVSPSFSAYWRGTLFANPWISLKMSLPIYANYNHDQIFTEYKKKWDFLITPEIELKIIPANIKTTDDNKKEHVKIFARVRYYDMPWARGNNFVQFHTGVSIPLTDLFKK